ncbi:DUF2188 domain-containing protein [Bacillus safensis]|uniref:DUF2188 domain-containing protein n=1 Tax=Bacillus safensis TaxID=561879 RepID=UPI000B4383BC|nr:DUF2188 domain-containing protein [Bacillus safensis]MCY7493418.1 DUF2188 domain-containing protein [Bacillus safensis]MED4992222.1 DUF2188 domain-containing protein [Bacillus safensis]UDB47818.1 DUF2188 domain-containing protein [Bacillus safensis]
MPWTMNDYPASFKSLDNVIRKKALEIANKMIQEGYEENRAIPIAISQAKEWKKNAAEKDVENFSSHGSVKPTESSSSARPELMDHAQHVVKHEEGWAIQTEKAKRASEVKETKQEAIDRAKEISANKGTSVVIHRKDGTIQNVLKPQ